jgi:hypothetical protein
MVAAFIASLNVAVTAGAMATPVAPLDGAVAVTVGTVLPPPELEVPPPQPVSMSDTTNKPRTLARIIQLSFALSIAGNHLSRGRCETTQVERCLKSLDGHLSGMDDVTYQSCKWIRHFPAERYQIILLIACDYNRRIKATAAPKKASRRLHGAMARPVRCVTLPYCTVRFT